LLQPEADIEEKRLKLNAERTIKQNKAAETGKHIAKFIDRTHVVAFL
jgi:formylmethanofuran dehydrogenase subunit D